MNKRMNSVRNLFAKRTCARAVRPAIKRVQTSNFLAALLFSLILLGAFTLSYTAASMNSLIIKNIGTIGCIVANTGSAEDIQAAVDEAAALGIRNVVIPEGVFNFVEPGEPWVTVTIPAGINLFGAPTERTSGQPEPTYGMSPNDQVIDWKTVLVMPDPLPSNPYPWVWFSISGTGAPNQKTRISDISFQGYRSPENAQNPNNPCASRAITLHNVMDFRIDHCKLFHIVSGIWIGGPPNSVCRGVIDHCNFTNEWGLVNMAVADCTVYYGVGMGRLNTDYWDPDIENILGKYLNYTVFIEDNYFRRWRHCTASNQGQHYVFRHNTIEHSGGLGDVDAHGVNNIRGTRAMEVYNNEIVDPVNCQTQYDSTWPNKQIYARGIWWRGGGGVMFNNYIRNYNWIIEFMAQEFSGEAPECTPRDVWIWNNIYDECGPQHYTTSTPPVNEGEHYKVMGSILEGETEPYWPVPPEITYPIQLPGPTYVGKPSTLYMPYPYPHPLTLQAAP